MNHSKKDSPAIRLTGFTGAWEQRKLKDFSDKVLEKNTNYNFSETFTNSAEFGVVSQRDFFDKDISNKENLSNYYIVENDDFIYNPRISNFAPVGPIKRNKLGRSGVMSPLYYVFRVYNTDHQFLEYFFETSKWHTFMKLNGDSGARADRFSIKDHIFCEMPIMFPTLEEQTQIGNFFKQLDETIALHKRTLEKHQNLKKFYLEKMFPKENQQFPEVRFPNFTDAWEQRKLGDLGNVVMCKRIFKHQTNEKAGIPFYKIGTFSYVADAYISHSLYNEYKTKYPYPKEGDILISAAGTIGRTITYNGEKAYYQDSNIVWLNIDKRKISNIFLKYFYKIAKWNGIEGSTIQRLYNFNILSTNINLPSLKEQTQIGNFFKQLDETITLHKRKVEKFEKIKQAYLEKMFI